MALGNPNASHEPWADACDTQAVVRKFNLEGPVVAERHYCIPPLSRVDLDQILELIEDMRYFVLQAPRQTGKTSILLALQDRLNAEGKYRCLYVNFEGGQAAAEDTAAAMQALLGEIGTRARRVLADNFVDRSKLALATEFGPHTCFAECLTRWAEVDPKPLVLLIDEIDTLVGDTLLSVLRQLRLRYDLRPDGSPQSVILCGVRDVRDCQIYSSREGASVKGGQRLQHQGSLAAVGRLLGSRGDGTASAAHRRARTSLRSACCGAHLDALLRPAVAGQRAGRPSLLRGLGRPRQEPAHPCRRH